MNNYFYHHGIDGQKWGKRNGPPYPLNRDSIGRVIKKKKSNSEPKGPAKSAMSFDEAKERAKNSGRARDVIRYRDTMSNQELSEAVNRINWYMRLDEFNAKQTKTAFDRLDSYMKKLNTIANWAETISKIYKLMPDSVKKGKTKKP